MYNLKYFPPNPDGEPAWPKHVRGIKLSVVLHSTSCAAVATLYCVSTESTR